MKLNFWQWLGVIILAIAVPLYIYFNFVRKPVTEASPETDMSVPSLAAPDTGSPAADAPNTDKAGSVTPTTIDGPMPGANPTDTPAN
jgi:hypothetical protein